MIRKCVIALAAALAAACASEGTRNADPGYRPGGTGLLVASLTVSGYTPGTLWLQVVRADATETVASIPVNDAAHGLDWPAGDPAVPHGAQGRLAAIELAPGDYELRRWVMNVGNREAYASVRPIGIRFAVEPGKVTYLGAVHLDVQRTAGGGRLPFAVRVEDRRSRDLPLLHRKYAGVRPEHVRHGDGAAPDDDPLQGLLRGR